MRVNPAGAVKVSVTVAPGVNPEMLKVNQPKGVEMPLGAPAGVATICALPMLPLLASSITVPASVAKLQVAPVHVALLEAMCLLWLLLHALASSAAHNAVKAIRLTVTVRRPVAPGSCRIASSLTRTSEAQRSLI